MDKPKNDPEKELSNRKVISNVVIVTLMILFFIFTVWYVMSMVDQMLPFYLSEKSNPVKFAMAIVAGVALALVCMKAVAGYFAYNQERIETLQKIVESENTGNE
jgi:magnesium-transporting ATPase (P-type)